MQEGLCARNTCDNPDALQAHACMDLAWGPDLPLTFFTMEAFCRVSGALRESHVHGKGLVKLGQQHGPHFKFGPQRHSDIHCWHSRQAQGVCVVCPAWPLGLCSHKQCGALGNGRMLISSLRSRPAPPPLSCWNASAADLFVRWLKAQHNSF